MVRCGACLHLHTPISLPRPVAGSRLAHHVQPGGKHSMATYQLNVNGQRKEVKVDPSTPLLWVLREELKMTGTKYGCGISVCGACTVHLDGVATRSCVVPISLLGNRRIVTIEGIGSDPVGRVVQDAWVEKDVVQCGYCQSGQIMS